MPHLEDDFHTRVTWPAFDGQPYHSWESARIGSWFPGDVVVSEELERRHPTPRQELVFHYTDIRGLQGIVEAFGGELGVLDCPVHGKPSRIINNGQGIFEGLPKEFAVGRYHSLYALRDKLPACLEITAESDDGVIMGIRHKTLPIEAVQFHPESILSAAGENGLKLMRNALRTANRPVSV